ncbi:MAG: tripartite tricarboxylate transporter substrate-binding protein [Acetobacteraceae bacterium]|nr:tripartite tricarboxylate transporter substrate-binding protein [Acetobacteraceae bacterium]MCX7683826.1 tripartite tricarboxylate transporter substrate-binding protein [Acetobacteraceae bacterium]MDW8397786.1 tripartite tricarboxylate transporter substrate-binding protein [Acetobacteraceae bacterium]
MTSSIARRTLLAGTAGLALLPRGARAWPQGTIRIVVPYAPGGTNDILARLLAARMQELFGQPVVVENRPGAQAISGTELVARARPDGATLLVAASGPIVFNPALIERLPYDPERDLSPVTRLVSFPLMLLVRADSPYRSLADLVAAARRDPQGMNYSTPATSFRLAMELFNRSAGARFTAVLYRGVAPSITAVLSGEVPLTLSDTVGAVGALGGGQLRALAVTSARRLDAFPDVPTFAEAGHPEVRMDLWAGLLAPAGTPGPIVARLHDTAAAILAEPPVRERLRQLLLVAEAEGPAGFAARIREEIALWRRVAQEAGVRLEEG